MLMMVPYRRNTLGLPAEGEDDVVRLVSSRTHHAGKQVAMGDAETDAVTAGPVLALLCLEEEEACAGGDAEATCHGVLVVLVGCVVGPAGLCLCVASRVGESDDAPLVFLIGLQEEGTGGDH